MSLTNFKPYYQFIDNQARHTWIIISGWALLGSFVIKPVKKSNILFISDYNPYLLSKNIEKYLCYYGIHNYSVMGFSLGALWLSHYLSYFTQAKHMVFSGVRSSYPSQPIQRLRIDLDLDKDKVLSSFWKDCRPPITNKKNFVKSHTEYSWQDERLLRGLDYLEKFKFHWPAPEKKILFFHGQLDRIAPLKEITKQNNYDFRVIKRQGHICLPDLDGI